MCHRFTVSRCIQCRYMAHMMLIFLAAFASATLFLHRHPSRMQPSSTLVDSISSLAAAVAPICRSILNRLGDLLVFDAPVWQVSGVALQNAALLGFAILHFPQGGISQAKDVPDTPGRYATVSTPIFPNNFMQHIEARFSEQSQIIAADHQVIEDMQREIKRLQRQSLVGVTGRAPPDPATMRASDDAMNIDEDAGVSDRDSGVPSQPFQILTAPDRPCSRGSSVSSLNSMFNDVNVNSGTMTGETTWESRLNPDDWDDNPQHPHGLLGPCAPSSAFMVRPHHSQPHESSPSASSTQELGNRVNHLRQTFSTILNDVAPGSELPEGLRMPHAPIEQPPAEVRFDPFCSSPSFRSAGLPALDPGLDFIKSYPGPMSSLGPSHSTILLTPFELFPPSTEDLRPSKTLLDPVVELEATSCIAHSVAAHCLDTPGLEAGEKCIDGQPSSSFDRKHLSRLHRLPGQDPGSVEQFVQCDASLASCAPHSPPGLSKGPFAQLSARTAKPTQSEPDSLSHYLALKRDPSAIAAYTLNALEYPRNSYGECPMTVDVRLKAGREKLLSNLVRPQVLSNEELVRSLLCSDCRSAIIMGFDRECAFCHRNYLHHKSVTQGIAQPRPNRHPRSHNEVLSYEEAPAWPPKPQHTTDID